MACSTGFGVWVVEEKDGKECNRNKIYVNPNDKISKLKQEVAKKTKTREQNFCLFDFNTELEDDKTVKDYNIKTGCILMKVNKTEDTKVLKLRIRRNTEPGAVKQSSPYGSLNTKGNSHKPMRKSMSESAFVKKKADGKPRKITKVKSLEAPNNISTNKKEELQEHSESTETKNDSQTQIPLPSLVKETENNENSENIPLMRAPVSAVDHGRDQSREEDDVKRPRTADAKVFFALSQRPLSTLNNRTSSTSDLTALDTELLCNKEASKALKIATSERNNESQKYSEALRQVFGDIVEAIHDPVLLSGKLYQEGLISFQVHKDMTSICGWTDTFKATKLLNHVKTQLMISKRPLEVLKSFSKAISSDSILVTFISKIEDHVGCEIQSTRPTCSPTTDVRKISRLSAKRCQECLVTKVDIPSILYRTTIDCKQSWYNLGAVLGLSIEELDLIEKCHSNSLANCYSKMISTWVNCERLQPTWQMLTRHLMQPLEQYDLGMQLRKENCKGCCYSGYLK